ncbi:MAG: hypothetical protein SVR81_08940, partial [Chloroflexota bacterium]|nr:hypothetical protein [Chloroflexota bacterium]
LRNAHPALRGGEYLPLSSSCRQVYAVLRLLEEDALLIIANFSRGEQEACTFSIEESSLEGAYQLETLLGSGDFPPIQFDGNGAVTAYLFPETLKPWEQFVIQLTK